MKNSFKVFKRLMSLVNDDFKLYRALKGLDGQAVDPADVLRWQWTQSVSALDKLVHDLVRIGMMETFLGKRVPTTKYGTFAMTLNNFLQIAAASSGGRVSIFEHIVLERHSHNSFQDPDKISDALSLIWDEQHKWQVLAGDLSLSQEDARSKLKSIVERRNQIVHEGDFLSQNLSRQVINQRDVRDVVTFVRKLGNAIFKHVIK